MAASATAAHGQSTTAAPAVQSSAKLDTAGYTADQQALMKADRDFQIATKKDGAAGWMGFWADDAASWRDEGFIQGTTKLTPIYTRMLSNPNFVLEWQPTAAVMYAGGTLGATTGRFQSYSRAADGTRTQTGHGHYVTVWRKDNGQWKVVLDGGYGDPK